MYEGETYVFYGVQGVCRVLGTEVQRINRVKTEYLVLEPIEKAQSRFYVPIQNPSAMQKLRPVLTKDELEELLDSAAVREKDWIPEENRRKQYFREILSGGDRTSVMRMLCNLYRYRNEQMETGRKFHQSDDHFLQEAERLLCTEIILVMNLNQSEAREYIRNTLS